MATAFQQTAFQNDAFQIEPAVISSSNTLLYDKVYSETALVNRALTKLGARRIMALNDDSNEARVADSLYVSVRNAELRAHPWAFAIRRISLGTSTTNPVFGYAYNYPLPDDCLRVVQVGETYLSYVSLNADYRQRYTEPFRIEDNAIVTDEAPPLYIRYVTIADNVGRYDSLFVEALACRLAVEMAEALTQSATKRELAHREYKAAIAMAYRTQAIERPPEYPPDNSWLLSRIV